MLECIEVFSSRNMSQVVSYFTAQLLCECGLNLGSGDCRLEKADTDSPAWILCSP